MPSPAMQRIEDLTTVDDLMAAYYAPMGATRNLNIEQRERIEHDQLRKDEDASPLFQRAQEVYRKLRQLREAARA